jgi:acetyl esterase/lipase
MTFAPPSHLSEAASAYLRDPDVLEYATDWTDAWDVHTMREIAHPLWSAINQVLDFHYTVTEELVGGVVTERISAAEQPRTDTVILHFHGGMYCLGTPEIDRVLNAPMARATGMDVVSVDYRLAPEHPFPAAITDALAVWKALTDDGIRIIVLGESAGGGLAAAATIAARDHGLPAADALLMISPMLDLKGTSDSYHTLADADPDYGHDIEILLAPGRAYAAETPLDHPLVSPMYADLHHLPPTLIHVGTREVLFGDAARFARAARRAGNSVALHALDGGWHNSPIWYGVPEADAAIADFAAFIQKVM